MPTSAPSDRHARTRGNGAPRKVPTAARTFRRVEYVSTSLPFHICILENGLISREAVQTGCRVLTESPSKRRTAFRWKKSKLRRIRISFNC